MYAAGIIISILIVIIVGSAITLYTSPLFLWELLPQEAEVRGVLNLAYPHMASFAAVIMENVQAEYTTYIPESRVVAFSKTGNSYNLVIVPARVASRATQTTLVQRLARQGWQTQHLGSLIIARKGTASPQTYDWRTIGKAAVHAVERRVKHKLASQPLIFAVWKKDSIPGLSDEGGAAIGFMTDFNATDANANTTTMEIWIAPNENELQESKMPIATFPKAEDELFIALPSHIFEKLPSHIENAWNAVVLSKLGFVHTRPSLLTEPRLSKFIVIASRGGNNAFGVYPSAESSENIAEAIQQEEAYSRPQKKAFRLSDGTIGIEYVPGEQTDVLRDAERDSCQQAQWRATTISNNADVAEKIQQQREVKIWLCAQTHAVAVGTDEQLTREILSMVPSNSWHVRVGHEWLKTLEYGRNSKTFAIAGNITHTDIKLHFTK